MQRLIVAALLVLAACHHAENTSSDTAAATTDTTATTVTSPAGEPSPPLPANVTPGDRSFAETAARMGMAEVQLSTNVSNRAQTQEVRSFASQMMAEHNRSNQELTTLAARKGIDPPADLDAKHKELDTKLAALTVRDLDRVYMQAMVDDHATAVTQFETAAAQLTDPDLKAWAAKTLPVLREHHRMAQEILAAVK
ncbi:MAG: putative rane protein [Acidobacteriota bacterium]|jgi:putative membrane protein|nr:putative rane protein [Acidobacteriota bacterium]